MKSMLSSVNSIRSQGYSVFVDGTISNFETSYGHDYNQEVSAAPVVARMRISVAYVKTKWP